MSILLIGVFKLNPQLPLTQAISSLTQPILAPFVSARLLIEQQQSLVSALPSLHEENQKLKQENSHLKIIVKKLSESVNNQDLIKKINERSWQAVPVKLVRLDNLATFSGPDLTGILPGQPVTSDDVIVGIVKKVEAPIIFVSPLDSADIKIDAQLEGGSQGKYISRDGIPTITNLDNGTSFSSRTTLFTLPTKLIPENLIIGQIDKVITNSANPVQEATVKLDKNIASAKNFLIITKP